VVSVRP